MVAVFFGMPGPTEMTILAIIVVLVVLPVYLLSLCLERIPREYRQMQPWQIWILLVPFVALVWNFFAFPRLARSYQSYFSSEGKTDVGDCGEQVGVWYAVCVVLSLIPTVNHITGPVALILLVVFLVKALTLRQWVFTSHASLKQEPEPPQNVTESRGYDVHLSENKIIESRSLAWWAVCLVRLFVVFMIGYWVGVYQGKTSPRPATPEEACMVDAWIAAQAVQGRIGPQTLTAEQRELLDWGEALIREQESQKAP